MESEIDKTSENQSLKLQVLNTGFKSPPPEIKGKVLFYPNFRKPDHPMLSLRTEAGYEEVMADLRNPLLQISERNIETLSSICKQLTEASLTPSMLVNGYYVSVSDDFLEQLKSHSTEYPFKGIAGQINLFGVTRLNMRLLYEVFPHLRGTLSSQFGQEIEPYETAFVGDGSFPYKMEPALNRGKVSGFHFMRRGITPFERQNPKSRGDVIEDYGISFVHEKRAITNNQKVSGALIPDSLLQQASLITAINQAGGKK